MTGHVYGNSNHEQKLNKMSDADKNKMADADKNKKRAPWTEVAEVRLCSMVKANWQLLFGEISGCGIERISARPDCHDKERRIIDKDQCSLQDHLYSEFTDKRTAEQCRKKYQNLKSRSINKVSGLRHPPTGGGPAPVLSQAESFIADHLKSHEVVAGITGGFDSDAAEPTSATISQAVEPITGALLITGALGSCPSLESSPSPAAEPTNHTVQAVEPVTGAPDSCPSIPTPEPSKTWKRNTEKGKRKHEDITSLTNTNLQLDNERLRAEIKKIKLEVEVLEEQRHTLKAVKELAEAAKEYVSKKCFTDFCSGEKFIDSLFQSNSH